MTLPAPKGRLTLEGVAYMAPGGNRPILRGVNFVVEPGTAVGVVGPSAAGKSTLCRLICGLYPPTHGPIRLDGAETHFWQRGDLGRYVGYLPQDVEIFSGTVRENISRMDPNAPPEAVIEAAQLAGIETMIRGLPHGYDTRIGENGVPLSGGQKQRIALARALFRRPKLVVLDEPNASLDNDGERALEQAISDIKSAGAAVIIVAHKPNILLQSDFVLVLREGVQEMFGPRDEVLARIAGPQFLEAARRQVGSDGSKAEQPRPQAGPQPGAQAGPAAPTFKVKRGQAPEAGDELPTVSTQMKFTPKQGDEAASALDKLFGDGDDGDKKSETGTRKSGEANRG
jgi:ABC-type protease/lipase transport system fused ATPase/permease subunit